MEILKIIGIGFLTLIITLTLKEYRKEMAVYSVLIGGAIIIYYSLGIITEIIDLLKSILQNSNYNNMFVSVLLKITGIALLTEYAVSVCKDLGENSIANKIDFGGKKIVISLSIPIISNTLETLTEL